MQINTWIATIMIFLSAPLAHYRVTQAADFTVSTVTEFQNALDLAQSNGQSDTIRVAAGNYSLSTPLRYSCNDGDGQLTITAVNPSTPPVLDGEAATRLLYLDNDADNDQTGDSQADITIRNLILHNGHYASYGGGLLLRTGEADIVISSCVFSDNRAEYTGGGAYVHSENGSLSIHNNTFLNNTGAGGGGIFAWSGTGSVELTINQFDNNRAEDFVPPCGGGAKVYSESGFVTLNRNTFFNNTASYGGGVCSSTNSGTVKLTNNIFSSNNASYGGGAAGYPGSGALYFTNNSFWQNTASYKGGGVHVKVNDNSGRVYFRNNIIWDNTVYGGNSGGDDLYADLDGDDDGTGAYLALRNNDLGINSNFDTAWSEDFTVENSDHYNHWNNITLDPGITATGHISRTSPAIDAGVCGLHKGNHYLRFAPYDDMDGDKRPGDEQVYGCDIGADEYKPFPWPMFLPAIVGNSWGWVRTQ